MDCPDPDGCEVDCSGSVTPTNSMPSGMHEDMRVALALAPGKRALEFDFKYDDVDAMQRDDHEH